jgi:hypothetical protein
MKSIEAKRFGVRHHWPPALALAALVLVGCNTAADDPAQTLHGDEPVHVSSRQRIDVDVRPAAPIQLGKNSVFVQFPADVQAELATVAALMPAHGHGSQPPTIERVGTNAFVVNDIVLYMSGRWELRLGLRVGAQEDEAIVAVDVP